MGPDDQLPLSGLLSRALIAFARTFESEGGDPQGSPFVVWSNVLRLFDGGPILRKELPTLARLSSRAMKAWIDRLERVGLVVVEADPANGRSSQVRLTDEGRALRERCAARLPATEQRFRDELGASPIDGLRTALVRLVAELDLELPSYITGYGPADASMTGGAWTFGSPLPAEPGPPRLPVRGRDWRPVVRADRSGAPLDGLPLSALLSQVLVAFAIDYESTRQGPLVFAADVLRHIDDGGVAMEVFSRVAPVTGDGKSTLERHGVVTVDAGSGTRRLVRLTPHGRDVRDSYSTSMASIEAAWQTRHGRRPVRALREALEAIDDRLDPALPHFPVVRFEAPLGFTESSQLGAS